MQNNQQIMKHKGYENQKREIQSKNTFLEKKNFRKIRSTA